MGKKGERKKTKVLKYLKPYWGLAILAPLLMVLEVVMDLIQPQLMSKIIDDGVLGLETQNIGDLHVIISTGLLMILFVVIGGFFGIMCGVVVNFCGQNFSNDLRKDCFKSIMSFSFQQTEQFSTGSLVTRVTNDITQIQNLANTLMRGLSRTLVMFVGGIVCMLLLDLKFGLVIAAALPVVFVVVLVIIKKANPIFEVLQKKLDRVNTVMQEDVAGLRVVKACVRESYEKKRFGEANEDMVNSQLKVLLILSYLSPLMNMILNCVVVAMIKVGGIEVSAGAASPGNIVAAITYVSQILNGILQLVMIFQMISRGTVSIQRVEEVLDTTPAIMDGKKSGKEKQKEKITMEHVWFAYPNSGGETVLQDVNLSVEPGETLAILGATGSGKSTLVHLIPRFYDVNAGRVCVDGIDVKEYSLQELRSKVAIALQKAELFSTTIRENIAWGKEGSDEAKLRQAAAVAQAIDFIDDTEEGLDTLVAEKGMSLSGGQKQRIVISRAIVKEAEILILDDSTSALDLKTEADLYEALSTRYPGMTKIIIAQRIASVRGADRIAVMENGRIAACGTHSQLLRESGIYRAIYDSQWKGGDGNNE